MKLKEVIYLAIIVVLATLLIIKGCGQNSYKPIINPLTVIQKDSIIYVPTPYKVIKQGELRTDTLVEYESYPIEVIHEIHDTIVAAAEILPTVLYKDTVKIDSNSYVTIEDSVKGYIKSRMVGFNINYPTPVIKPTKEKIKMYYGVSKGINGYIGGSLLLNSKLLTISLNGGIQNKALLANITLYRKLNQKNK